MNALQDVPRAKILSTGMSPDNSQLSPAGADICRSANDTSAAQFDSQTVNHLVRMFRNDRGAGCT